MALSKEACKIIHKTEKILSEPYAWRKGAMVGEHSRAPGGKSYCLVGALRVASGGTPYGTERSSHYWEAVKALCGKLASTSQLIAFNDKKGGRKQNVLDLLRKTREREGC
jgi:hypothetical protein